MREELARPARLPGPYFIKDGYRERPSPRYDDLTAVGTNWQSTVYERAAEAAASYGASLVIDVGCGDGRNLPLLGAVRVIGMDYGANLEAARASHPNVEFVEIDLDSEVVELPVDTRHAVIICADVIEHLRRPELLLGQLRRALENKAYLVLLSTPERDLWWGRHHFGPPPNEGHVREWNRAEFGALLASERFTGQLEIVRSNDVGPERKTLLAKLDGVRALE